MQTSDFDYDLPQHLIAQQPLAQRTASRLLCLNRFTKQFQDKQFIDFIDLLQENDLLVFNDTKVIPARLFGHKSTGAKVELLIERISDSHHAIAHIKTSKTPKAGTIIELAKNYRLVVQGRAQDLFVVELINNTDSTLADVLHHIGHIPLPPYIRRADNGEDLNRYQTVFAKQVGAVAAPTAGLHFDEAMLKAIAAKNIATCFVTLHVGSGTFQPVRVNNLSQHVMHHEYFNVSAETVEAVKQTRLRGGRVIAIGTTAVRALESASQSGELMASCGETNLFITPNYIFKSVDALLTNFHLPQSTLLMLIAAFAGYEVTMNAYKHAIAQNYRFFSYGDAMLVY